jgi:serine/threonine protein kinase, bacterial
MAHPLLEVDRINDTPRNYLNSIGNVFAVFDERTQDSGNVSYSVGVGDTKYFVKTAGLPENPVPYLKHAQRVELLRNAVRVWESCKHSSLAPLLHTIESPEGPLLVYAWLDAELLHQKLPRFQALSADEILLALDTLYDVHGVLAAMGWVACDLYDGCLMYDYQRKRLWVMDIDTYHAGSFVNEMGRMFGSTRFMAPEEFQRGATIDQRTTVFTLGRMAAVLLSDGSLNRTPFRGIDATYAVIYRACEPVPENCFATVAQFHAAWLAARKK